MERLTLEWDFGDLFALGMKRSPGKLLVTGGAEVNCGSGKSAIDGMDNLDLPDWRAPILPYSDDSVGTIHAYHFLEHLEREVLYTFIGQVERVLVSGGLFNYCVPYALSPIASMDVTHRTFWTEETMRTLLESRGYESAAAERLSIEYQIIAGINSQNLAVLGQLRRRSRA